MLTLPAQVRSLSKGFSSFSEADGKRYLGLDTFALIEERDDQFAAAAVQRETPIRALPGATVESVIDRAISDLYMRLRVYTPLQGGSEYTRRELVSPILLAAAVIACDISLHAEYGLEGRLGNGPVDYVALYKHFAVLLTEAKQEKLMAAIGQARNAPSASCCNIGFLRFLRLHDFENEAASARS